MVERVKSSSFKRRKCLKWRYLAD